MPLFLKNNCIANTSSITGLCMWGITHECTFFFFLVLIPLFCNTVIAKVSNFLVVGYGPARINIIKNVGLLFSGADIKYWFCCVSLHIRI